MVHRGAGYSARYNSTVVQFTVSIFCTVEERACCTEGLVTVPDIIVQLYSSLYLYCVLQRSEHAAQWGWLQCRSNSTVVQFTVSIFCTVEERACCTEGLVTVPDLIVQLYSSLYLYFVLQRSEHAAQWGWLQCQISDIEFRIRQNTELYRLVKLIFCHIKITCIV